eukprot:scaffold93233_cov45-Phaeocystis_antarctica.AAC.1
MTRLGQCELEADASPNELNCDSSGAQTKTTTVITGNGGTRNNSVDEHPRAVSLPCSPYPSSQRVCVSSCNCFSRPFKARGMTLGGSARRE